MIGGMITVDLTRESPTGSTRDRHLLAVLARCPDGVRVTIDVGARAHLSHDVVNALHRHGHRLELTVAGTDPIAVARFVIAARTGVWTVAS